MVSLHFTVLFFTMVLFSVNAGPARKIYKMELYRYPGGRLAIDKLRNGKTELYYYHLGYGRTYTKFTGGRHSCAHFRYEIGVGRTIYGFGYKCTLSSHTGTFEVEGGSRPYLYGTNFLRQRI